MGDNVSIDLDKVLQAVEPGMEQLAADMTEDYAEMAEQLKGRPLDEIKAELVRYHQGREGELTDPELTQFAEEIQRGEAKKFTYDD